MSELSKLKWQCRRGSKELDLVLNRYLEQHYPMTSPDERHAFKDLLKLEDPQLYALILGEQEAQDSIMKRVINDLRNL